MKSFSMHPQIKAYVNTPFSLDFSQPFEGQVKTYLEGVGDLRGFEVFGLVGQAAAAALLLPALELSTGLPKVFLFEFGKQAEELVVLDLEDYRHNHVRPLRAEVSGGEAYPGYTILDGAGRGVPEFQLEEIAEALGTDRDNIRVVNVGLGQTSDFSALPMDVARKLVESSLTKDDWISGRLLFLPPGMGTQGIVLNVAIYGLSEVWPRTIRLNKGGDEKFHVAEILNCQDMRQWGVELFQRWMQSTEQITKLAEAFRVFGFRADIKKDGVRVYYGEQISAFIDTDYLPVIHRAIAETLEQDFFVRNRIK